MLASFEVIAGVQRTGIGVVAVGWGSASTNTVDTGIYRCASVVIRASGTRLLGMLAHAVERIANVFGTDVAVVAINRVRSYTDAAFADVGERTNVVIVAGVGVGVGVGVRVGSLSNCSNLLPEVLGINVLFKINLFK